MKKLLLITTATILALSATHSMATDKSNSTTLGQKIDDAKIVTVVNADLVKDKELSALKINVDSTQGKVLLQGTAPNMMAKERAEKIAKSVEGVTSVDNKIVISTESKNSSYNTVKENTKEIAQDTKKEAKDVAHKAEKKLDDAGINVAINSSLAADSELSALKINVDVTNGNVLLKGTAPSMMAKNRATELAHKVDGVKSVNNQLTVSK